MNNTKLNSRGASLCVSEMDRLVSKADAAKIGGVSVRTLEREISAGRIKKRKMRGCVRLRLSDVWRWAGLESNL